MTEQPLSEQDFIDAFEKAGLDLRSPEDSAELKAALLAGLQSAISGMQAGKKESARSDSPPTTEHLKARLMAEAEAMGASNDPATLLKIGLTQARPAVEPALPDDISGITSPTELLRIGFAKGKVKK